MSCYEYRIRPNELINKIELKILKKIGKKKLIGYGTTSRWADINRIVYLEDKVVFFVDSDSNKWGTVFCGKEVKNPEELKKINYDEYAVAVLSAAFEEIKMVLDDMGMKQEINYFNIYQYLHVYDGRPFGSFNKFMTFLDTVPDEIGDIKPSKKGEKIGIVLSVEGFSRDATDVPYLVSLFLILKWHGYNVKLIIDRLQWEGDIVLYEGRSEVCRDITELIVCRLKEMVPSEDLLFLDFVDADRLSSKDEEECEKIAEYSARWMKWQNLYNPQFLSVNTLQCEMAKIYKRNLPCIEKFFDKNHFDTINASTALHARGGVYNYVGKKRKIRVSSADGIGETTKISANGAASRQEDITYLLEGTWMNEEEEQEVLQRASKLWDERKVLPLTVKKDTTHSEYVKMFKEKGYSHIGFQIPRAKEIKAYDVVIPLNLVNDGASLGIETVFKNREHWLIETLDFVINKMGNTVLIREHPAARMLPDFNECSELFAKHPEILAPYKGNPSLLYVKSDQDINLYQYIEQCKVVIPWTSTVGIEAGLLKKNVLMHTSYFYKNSSFVLSAFSRDDYFNLLKKCILENKYLVENKQKAYDDALKYFYYAMHGQLVTDFTSLNTDFSTYTWSFMTFNELVNAEGVDETIQIVAENVPSVYLIEKQYRRLNNMR